MIFTPSNCCIWPVLTCSPSFIQNTEEDILLWIYLVMLSICNPKEASLPIINFKPIGVAEINPPLQNSIHCL